MKIHGVSLSFIKTCDVVTISLDRARLIPVADKPVPGRLPAIFTGALTGGVNMAENRDFGEQSTGEQSRGGHVSSEFTDVLKWVSMLGHLEKRASDAAQQLEETGVDTEVVQDVYDIANVCGLLTEKLDRFAVSNLLDRQAA